MSCVSVLSHSERCVCVSCYRLTMSHSEGCVCVSWYMLHIDSQVCVDVCAGTGCTLSHRCVCVWVCVCPGAACTLSHSEVGVFACAGMDGALS